jgi:ABC-type nitrate/sulfonate/bicarbonate transport system substrate-binding protein
MVIITRRSFLKSIGGAVLTTTALGLPIRAQNLPVLKLSLPASIESVPIAYAVDQNRFADFGLDVELFAFARLNERDGALFAGAVDGAVSDLSSCLNLMDNNTDITLTSTAFESVDSSRRYSVMTHNFSFIEDFKELMGRLEPNDNRNKIGIIPGTDMEFETDKLITSCGFTVNEDEMYSEFGDVINLATLMAAGSQLSAVVPEPMVSYIQFITEASQTPSVVLQDYSDQSLVPAVLGFQNALIQDNPTLIENFYTAFGAVINEFATTPRAQIVDAALDAALAFFFPGISREELPGGAEEFLATYVIPTFPQPKVLSGNMYQEVVDWSMAKNYISSSIPFDVAFTDQFLT